MWRCAVFGFECGRVCGMRPFRRGLCIVIVTMRWKAQQLGDTPGRVYRGIEREAVQPLRCLKNSTCLSRFSASFLVLYGPPRFFLPLSETTLYPSATFLIIGHLSNWMRSGVVA